jgi:hypothetical protein
MELVSNCRFLEGQEMPPGQSSIGYKGSKTQSSYNGSWRQETDSFKGSKTQVTWSSPACPTLTGKTSLYKSYNTYS